MAGVIDADGQQWERCNGCAEFVKIETLLYEQPSEEFKYGRDLCPTCASGAPGTIVPQQLLTIAIPLPGTEPPFRI